MNKNGKSKIKIKNIKMAMGKKNINLTNYESIRMGDEINFIFRLAYARHTNI